MIEELETGRMRPNVRPWLIAAALNVTFAAVLIGIPYSRGPERAEGVLPRFVAFAACLYDAEPVGSPGLGLPRGERARYASLVVRADPSWPARCRPGLRAIPAEESTFLFPGVKGAEAQLREAVAQLDRELEALATRRAAGEDRVSDRPMRAMSLVRASLAELGVASGVSALSARRDAVTLPGGDLAAPSILPIRIATGGPFAIALRDGALLATAMDRRSVAHARVASGGIDMRITRRPRLVAAMLGAREPPWLVWSTRDCDEVGECARRATGLAALLEDRQLLEPMSWLAAHPVGAPEDAIHVEDRTAWVVATTAEGGAEVRRFTVPAPEVRALGAARTAPQLPAEARWPLAEGPARVAWVPGAPPRVVAAREGAADVRRLEEDAPEVTIEAPRGLLRIATCGDAEAGWIAIGSERGVMVSRAGSPSVAAELAVRPPERERLRVVCVGDAAHVLAVSDGALHRVICSGSEPPGCGEAEEIVDDVAGFDAVAFGDTTLIAWTDDAEAGAVRVTRIEGETVTTSVPSPCWTDPQDGLCGAPRLATDGAHVMLVVRQESDLRALVSEDGQRWSALEGLEQY